MGRPRVKIIDDSQLSAEIKDQKSKIKSSLKRERAKSEPVKADDETARAKVEVAEAIAEVERTDSVIAGEAKQSSTDGEDRHVVPQSGTPRDDKTKKPQKPGKAKPRSLSRAKPRGKKYQEASKDLDRAKTYPLTEAVDMVKKLSYSKFNGTLEAHIVTAQTGIRGLVSLPYASGRKLRILVFGKNAETLTSDTIMFGNDAIIEEIGKGKVNFDLVISTPEWMSKLARVAKILGPRGLMPNPKNNTITDPSADGLKKAVESFQTGKTEYKTESKAPVIHLALGKLNQPTEELSANVKTLLATLGKSRVKKVTLSPTMGPSVKVDLASI